MKVIYLVDCESYHHRVACADTDLVYYIYNLENSLPRLFRGELNANEYLYHVNITRCKDALDFIIDTMLGYLICKFGNNVRYIVMSYDFGYTNVSAFWRECGYCVDVMCEEKSLYSRDALAGVYDKWRASGSCLCEDLFYMIKEKMDSYNKYECNMLTLDLILHNGGSYA